MIKVTLVRELIGAPADIKFGDDEYRKVGAVIVASTRRNIQRQETIDGSRIKVNAKSTRRRKRRAGRPQLSLVDKDKRFVERAGYIITLIRNGVAVVPKAVTIARFVQKKGYLDWFGLGKDGIKAVRAIFRQSIEEARKKASKKRKRQRVTR